MTHQPPRRRDRSDAFLEPGEDRRYSSSDALTAGPFIAGNARLRVRARLTVACWAGDVDAASRVCAALADNGARFGGPLNCDKINLRLVCPADSSDLVIEVDDAEPDFPGFDRHAGEPPTGRLPSGLDWVRRAGGRLAWRVIQDEDGTAVGKTVQAVLPSCRSASETCRPGAAEAPNQPAPHSSRAPSWNHQHSFEQVIDS